MRASSTLITLLLTGSLCAQWDVPVRVVLEGGDPAQRQVTGLGEPLESSAGVSLASARARSTITAAAAGSSILTVELSPSPMSMEAGFELTLLPTDPHSADVQLVVNGGGPYELVKRGGLPLDSADMPVGMPARVVFDGVRFHLLTNAGKPCKTGFSAATDDHCIADSSLVAQNFREASRQCLLLNAKLCSLSEWAIGCQRIPGFLATVSQLEWVDHASNSQEQGKLAGIDRLTQVAGCTFGDTNSQSALNRFRCCMNR